MRVLSFLPAALCSALALASYMPDSGIWARDPAPSAAPCTEVTAANCPQTSLCGDGLNHGTYFSNLVECLYPPGTARYACNYYVSNGLLSGYTPGDQQCCPLYIGTCTSASKRALPEALDFELALARREQDMKRDIEDENQPW
ncbi:hypothetical protein CALCODRAFT_518329 [Calocera cornea HHB12733]|uniref:Uncharacterized protein n=1 Tax=Calocera cornea HHB12733 TaxID=1353952 RepID=A0A165F385_9BASI|nr:hypothetical protein CALCODRAFT_518329 [Calocera cornea HHB12733]